MTISDFSRDIESRTNRYVHLGVEDKMLPYLTILHISEVTAVGEFPAFILFTDRINKMTLTQIQSKNERRNTNPITYVDNKHTFIGSSQCKV